jgi:hypothetical protein
MRIRIREGKNDPQKLEKLRNFMFRNAGCSLLRAEGYPGYSFNGCLEKSKLQFLIEKGKEKNVQL